MTALCNAEPYVQHCIYSMKIQKEDFHCYITDDASEDGSVETIKETIKNDARFTLIQNSEKLYSTGNYHQISKLDIPDDSIVVTLDGDDWFSDEYVLTRVKSYYKKGTKMAFGQFAIFDGVNYSKGFTEKPQAFDRVRQLPWTTSHLKTFKMELFRMVKAEDLFSPSGCYWEAACDQAIIFPMIEMCSDEVVHFAQDINMIYNCSNPNNLHKLNASRQAMNSEMIRNKASYSRRF